ncbi:MAG: outer membrane beta-barrel protein [Bacteroidales bacterium]|nr:outer membrane beta-barrel protein [Bacteroidales bacterium]
MKGITLIFLLIIISLNVNGKNNTSIGFNFEPIISKNIYVLNPNAEYGHFIDLNEHDNWDFGYKFGVSFEKDIIKNCSVSIGLDYKTIQDIYYNDLRFVFTYHGIFPTYKSHNKLSTDLRYISLPIGLIYQVIDFKKFRVGINPKTSTDFLLNDNDSEDQFATNHSKIVLSSNIGMRIDFNLFEKVRFIITPDYGITISNINHIKFLDNNYATQRNHYFGLNLGLRYDL